MKGANCSAVQLHQFLVEMASLSPPAPHLPAAQFYKYTAPAAGFVVPWACSSAFDVTLYVDDGSGSPSCIGPFRGCDDPQITNVDSQTM